MEKQEYNPRMDLSPVVQKDFAIQDNSSQIKISSNVLLNFVTQLENTKQLRVQIQEKIGKLQVIDEGQLSKNKKKKKNKNEECEEQLFELIAVLDYLYSELNREINTIVTDSKKSIQYIFNQKVEKQSSSQKLSPNQENDRQIINNQKDNFRQIYELKTKISTQINLDENYMNISNKMSQNGSSQKKQETQNENCNISDEYQEFEQDGIFGKFQKPSINMDQNEQNVLNNSIIKYNSYIQEMDQIQIQEEDETFLNDSSFKSFVQNNQIQFQDLQQVEGEQLISFQNHGLSQQMVLDCDNVRISIKEAVEVKLTMFLKLFKDLIGKDLTKFSLPVFINEPTNILMKPAEFMFFNSFNTEASQKQDSTLRMLYVACGQIAPFFCVPGRSGKPFNPLLGETYELVTPNFRFFGEMVSHHPPICCFSCEGKNFQIERVMETQQQFTGKQVKVVDKNKSKIILEVQQQGKKSEFETYLSQEPAMIVGNLILGERYVEPQGPASIINVQTGDTAEIMFKERGWSTKSSEINSVKAIIKDKYGKERYSITGKYTEELTAQDLLNGNKWTLFKAPQKPTNCKKMFGMNYYSLQLNLLSEELQKKLPPTDSRFRPDMRQWENGNLEGATSEKVRMEINQRKRRQKTKELIEKDPQRMDYWDISDERTFYEPLFFKKEFTTGQNGKNVYSYVPKEVNLKENEKKEFLYWNHREKSNWNNIPKIYDNDCQAFY